MLFVLLGEALYLFDVEGAFLPPGEVKRRVGWCRVERLDSMRFKMRRQSVTSMFVGAVASPNQIGVGLPGGRRSQRRFFVILYKGSADRNRPGLCLTKRVEQLVVRVNTVVKRNRWPFYGRSEHKRSVVQVDIWGAAVVPYWSKAFPVAEQRFGPGKDEVFGVGFVAQQQHQYVIVLGAVFHPQEGATVIVDLRIVNSNMTAIRQDIIGVCFLQRLAKDPFNSATNLLAALSAFFPGSSIGCVEIRQFIAASRGMRQHLADLGSEGMHPVRVGQEGGQDFLVQPITVASRAAVAGVVINNVAGLLTNTRWVAEIRVPRERMDRGALQELR
jgi:hypothetical protein